MSLITSRAHTSVYKTHTEQIPSSQLSPLALAFVISIATKLHSKPNSSSRDSFGSEAPRLRWACRNLRKETAKKSSLQPVHCDHFLALFASLQQTSHRSSSELSPHPSTFEHSIAVDRHRLFPHWNVAFGHVSAKSAQRTRKVTDLMVSSMMFC